MDVNTNGVLFTAQAAGRQMARFGNRGSIILIASMSGSITNKVCRSRCRARVPSLTPPSERDLRTTHGCLTTRANRPYYRWPGAWRASLDLKEFESIRSHRGTSTLRKCAFPCGSVLNRLWVVPIGHGWMGVCRSESPTTTARSGRSDWGAAGRVERGF
jgi:hypothetical protein